MIISATCAFLVGKPVAGLTGRRREAQLRRRDGKGPEELAGARRPAQAEGALGGVYFGSFPFAVSVRDVAERGVSDCHGPYFISREQRKLP